MANLEELSRNYMQKDYNAEYADARVCQDIVLVALANSRLKENVTIKGGVVMSNITRNTRRATRDMDLDFIRYSLNDSAIRDFIEILNCLDGFHIQIDGAIKELRHQEYRGKQVHVLLSDDTGHSLRSKIDFGVHKYLDIPQDEYNFDVCLNDEGASLLINSKEQIFTEKLKSLLRFGVLSTRYKDVFDMCYLSDFLDKSRLGDCMDTYIFDDTAMKEKDVRAIARRFSSVVKNDSYIRKLERSVSANWLDMDIKAVCDKLLNFFEALEK